MNYGPSAVSYFNAYMYSDYRYASVGYQDRNNAGPSSAVQSFSFCKEREGIIMHRWTIATMLPGTIFQHMYRKELPI